MYLKALELHGFKSFPEKTILRFEKPVTAIVGPNGSGKSNIADALQWVMGEQSTKALRGGKMEDVIFGGTERRGAVGFAEVTLTLDNTDRKLAEDTDEVQITRRYYRSGESEYAINKKTVRLRDVNELFMDTGLGRDGYSIIGQGKIDSILSARSTDRREIFEEAAGISRYRHRKEEAERKLQYAEDDLLRINDKISEIEMQVEPLRKQSETAKRYLVLRDELRGLEIALWLGELDAIGEKNKKLCQEQIIANGAVEKSKKSLEALYAIGEQLSRRQQENDVESERVRASISKAEQDISEEKSTTAVLRANLEHNRGNISRIREDIGHRDDQSAGIQNQISERERRIKEIEQSRLKLQTEFADLAAELSSLGESEGSAENASLELQRKTEDLRLRTAEKQAELSSINALLEETRNHLGAVDAEIVEQRAKLNDARNDERQNSGNVQKTEEKAAALTNVVNGYMLKLDSAKRLAEETSGRRSELEIEHNSVLSRLLLLRDMERDYEGYNKAVKTVMREAERGKIRGIRGPVGELVKAPEKYALAVETAMGAAMQNVIVETESAAKSAIEFLKSQNAGRVTFLPMSVIRGSRLDEALKNETGFEGLAFDLVEFDEQYRNIYINLLGRTLIVDELDNAIRIAKRFNHRFRIVTLDGQVINAGGSMTGGSAGRSTGILTRANEIRNASEREKRLSKELEIAKHKQAESARALSKSEYELKTASDEQREVSEYLVKLKAESSHFKLLVDSLTERSNALDSERQQIAARILACEERRSQALETIDALESEAQKVRKALNESSVDMENFRMKRQAAAAEEAKLREKSASLEAEAATQRNSVLELEKLRKELSGDRDAQTRVIKELTIKCDEIEAEIKSRENKTATLREETQGLRLKLEKIVQEKLSIETERTKNDKNTQDLNRELLDLERESARIDQKLQAADMEEKQIIDRLWDNYELSRSAAMEQRIALENTSEAKKRTGELRKEISSLGAPNIGAIEEFERVNSRYTYLTEQRDDIDKSRKELLNIIGDITDNMTDIFNEEFKKIGDSFHEVFLEFFGGGKASIVLEDPDMPLESGIEIKVQPPGKAVKTLTLLSGGEKAFVAIALYFAILRIRPTPFVVMDEIEAALDEANVIRVSEYMRKLSDKTQFLTITHRRGTMEEADVLYGVTMQEKGVSRVLMIDLDEAEKSIDVQ